jgi:hypothetical protein
MAAIVPDCGAAITGGGGGDGGGGGGAAIMRREEGFGMGRLQPTLWSALFSLIRQRTGESDAGGSFGAMAGGGSGAAETSRPMEATKAVIERSDITHLPSLTRHRTDQRR